MRSSKKPIIASLLVLGASLLLAQLSVAQTAAQLEQLENLTPAQRAALLEALQDSSVTEQPEVTNPVVVTARELESTEPESDEQDEQFPAEMPDSAELTPFGYDLFAGEPTTFAPATDIPVPVDYVLGPGDTIQVQLFGGQNANYSLVVSRDGVLNFPDIGPVSVSGMKYSEMLDALQRRVAEQMIGVQASITMGPLRSIRVFVLGDAYRPGSYTVSSLSTMTNALFVSGGVKTIGSLRNIELKRNGRTVTKLDLYDLLLRGDTSGDARLQPGDVIFIPPIGRTVGVGGEVRRPAIYEMRTERSIGDAVTLAGGLLPTAYPQATRVERINADRDRTVIDVDLSVDSDRNLSIITGDNIHVYSVLEEREDTVWLSGNVHRDGAFQWRDGMRLTDLIASIQDVKTKTDLGYVLIRREYPFGQEISGISADLEKALAAPGGAADPRLLPRDQVMVFSTDAERSDLLQPMLDELKQQADLASPAQLVVVSGRVRAPGQYPLELNMRVSDLIRAGGGLGEAAYAVEAELTRYEVQNADQRITELIKIDIASLLQGDTSADLQLAAHDVLNIKEIPLWRELETVELSGEIRFPGRYAIRRGERLSSILERAGGTTDLAFAKGAIFLREELRQRELEQLEQLAGRIESQIAAATAEQDVEADAIEARDALLQQLRETEATGRLVIDLPVIMSGTGSSDADVLLENGDQILVPRVSQTVTVIGEVQYPTSHIFGDDLNRDDYIERSGGMTSEADKKRIYVVRADGSVEPVKNSRFFRNNRGGEIHPGDTVVVPLDADRTGQLALWTSVTSIIYNIGVAAAAVASF